MRIWLQHTLLLS